MDIFNEEKFEKGGVILERIHPDLDVQPYIPYYEKMGYNIRIVEKPNGWVELIGEKGVLPFDSEAQGYDKEGKPYGYDNLPFEDGGITTLYPIDLEREDAESLFKELHPTSEIGGRVWQNFLKTPMGLIEDALENKNYSKGGRTSIENDGVDFNEEMYRGILGDRDSDGTENADDVAPNDPEISDYIEKDTPFSKTFRTLLDDKRMYDDSMYSIIGEMEKILPQKFDIIARTKTPFSILKKLVGKKLKFKRDEYGKIENKGLTDVIGTTIATNNNSELMNLRGMIGVDNGDNGIFGEVIEVDDKFKIPACGYRAIHYIVVYNGVPVEIQLKTKRMKMLNEFSHPYYKADDLDCDGMGELAEIVVMADNGSKEAQKEFADIFADKDRMRSIISKSYARGGEVEWFDYSKIDLEELPYDLDRYFIKDADTKEIDLKLLEPTRAREKGVKNANKYMRMAYDGEIDRRKPISVYERNGEMFVFDGNSTIANAKNSGWKTIYVEMIDDPNEDFERGGKLEPSFEIVDYLKNHTKNEAYRFNNHNRRSRFITDKQYEVNRQYIRSYAKGGEVDYHYISEKDYFDVKNDFDINPKEIEKEWKSKYGEDRKFFDDLVKIAENDLVEYYSYDDGYDKEERSLFVLYKPNQKGGWFNNTDHFHTEHDRGNLKILHKFGKDVLNEYN
jgi:ppGpp synthetase/RelA/SpoT-type nucleotidyltranferase